MEKPSKSDLFGEAGKTASDQFSKFEERKKFIAPSALENPDDFKRKRDETAEALRRRDRESRFKSKRMENEEEFLGAEPEELAAKGAQTSEEPMGKMEGPVQTPMAVLAELPGILLDLRQTEREKCLSALRRLRKLLSAKGYTPIQEVIDAGVLPALLEYCTQEHDAQIQVTFGWGFEANSG